MLGSTNPSKHAIIDAYKCFSVADQGTGFLCIDSLGRPLAEDKYRSRCICMKDDDPDLQPAKEQLTPEGPSALVSQPYGLFSYLRQ